MLNEEQQLRSGRERELLARKLMQVVSTLITPKRILRWREMLVAEKLKHVDNHKALGRPAEWKKLAELALKFIKENPR
ncbi:MAG: hypothetical protein AB7I37_27310 [Pirellulales bacterium]